MEWKSLKDSKPGTQRSVWLSSTTMERAMLGWLREHDGRWYVLGESDTIAFGTFTHWQYGSGESCPAPPRTPEQRVAILRAEVEQLSVRVGRQEFILGLVRDALEKHLNESVPEE